MKRQPYPSYQDSGIEWLGEVPESWHIMRAKYCAKINMGQSPPSDDCNLNGIGLPFLQGNAEFGPLCPIPKQYCEKARKIARKGDFLISVRAPVGALNIADQDYGIGRGLCGITIGNSLLLSSFCWYLLNHVRIQLNFHATGSTYDAVSADDVGNILMLIPPPSEQLAIATYLDRKTANIDVLIATKEQQIKYLQEKHDALISHAVTKGLDPNASMKDTGFEWLGKIPDHWEVVPFKRLTTRIDVGIAEAATHAYCDEGIPIIRSTNIRPNKITLDDLLHIKEWFAEKNKSKYLLANDLVTVRTGAPGTTAVVPHELHNSQCFTLLISTLKPSQDSRYYSYFMNSSSAKYCFAVEGWGAAQINISVPIMQQLIVVKPPGNEQRIIADYLDQKTNYLDKLVMKIQKSIDKLHEYRVALISAAVTGKIDVRKEVS